MTLRLLCVLSICAAAAACGSSGDGAAGTGGNPGTGGSAGSGGSSNTGGSTGIVRPVLVSPCDALEDIDVQTAMGVAMERTVEQGVEGERWTCGWTAANGFRMLAETRLVSNAASYEMSWEEDFSPFSETMGVDWSPDGEQRVYDSDGASAATLFAYIINTDPIGRDVFVEMWCESGQDEMGNPTTIPIIDQEAGVYTLGEMISAATRAAQPPGVELPPI
jgi:hypothetical protein